MAGAVDSLEDMLFTEVDEEAVSDLVGSLESQLGDRKTSAGNRDLAPVSSDHFSGKVCDPVQPQQGQPTAAPRKESGGTEPGSTPSLSSTSISIGSGLPTVGAAPGPVPVGAASFHRAAVLGPSTAPGSSAVEVSRIESPALQSLNGGPVKLVTSTAGSGSVISSATSNFSVPVTPQKHPSPVTSSAQNGVEPKGGQQVTLGAPGPSSSASLVLNQSGPMIQPKILVSTSPIVLTTTSSPTTQSAINHIQGSSTVEKPVVNGVAQPAITVVRPSGVTVGAALQQQQRPGLVAGSTRPNAPQPPLAVRPQQQQQTTIQLPPGFTMPPGMVLVRTETGQLVMVPQQVLAQAQAKTQQAIRPTAPPTTGATVRVGAPTTGVAAGTTAPGTQMVRLAAPTPNRMVQPSNTVQKAITVVPGGAATSVKMATPQKALTVITTGGTPAAKPAVVPPAPLTSTSPAVVTNPPTRVTVVSAEMQENVKKCKNFLATLIKLASHNSPSPETSKNVKALVQDLLDAKIEPEEFTTRLQAELKSSPQPYLIPFLKKSLPALRQSLLSSQQSLVTTTVPTTSVQPPTAPGSVTSTILRPRVPISPAGGVRLNTPISTTTALSRPGVQTVQTRSPVVITQTLKTPGSLIRGPTIISKSPVNQTLSVNQKKLSDPGGGTFRDDDDINDVASMAGVNLNEENARILATSSELVGTKIRSCKDESFLPAGALHRRVMDTAKKLGVTEVPLEVVNFISHATQCRLRHLLEKASAVAQHRSDGGKDEDKYEQTSDVRSQLRFFEQLEKMEKQRKDEQEREILLKAAKSRARQEDPEQARLKQKAKEMQQQELAQMRQRDANLTALAAIGPRKKRKMDSMGGATPGTAEMVSGSGSSATPSRQQLRHRITRVNLRDFILCLEQEHSTSRSLLLYKALLK
ncbi:transcription initiation factor TFIID subunit 4-like isoform X3 [Cynoglossus semilaevis]|uniref:transcription initiation factor TFIID subunit 4-like isoform X3 n=1 Tax=Cynoglossus semilaevis TaxID=244447 RepID=UPI000495E73D|nr:transcription initiation factor TFIID subunit 4-like isoform X3 [Cynoglossus semilaevis]